MTPDPRITAVAVDGSTVRVAFSVQPDFAFHGLWLRDLCGCPTCVHGESRQKIPGAQGIAAGGRCLVLRQPQDSARADRPRSLRGSASAQKLRESDTLHSILRVPA